MNYNGCLKLTIYIYNINQVLITMVKSSYEIRGLKLKPSILLKQEDRLGKIWDETYETFKNIFFYHDQITTLT